MHQYPNTQMCNSEKRCSVKSLKFSSCFCYLVATWMVVTCELAVVVDVALMRCSVLLVEDLLVVDVSCDMMMLLNCQQATADTASYKSQEQASKQRQGEEEEEGGTKKQRRENHYLYCLSVLSIYFKKFNPLWEVFVPPPCPRYSR